MIGEPNPSPEPIEPHMIDRAALLKRFGMAAPPAAEVRYDASHEQPIDLLTVADLAHRMSVSMWCIRNWLKDGTLPLTPVPLGKLILVRRADYEAWLASAA